MADEFEALAFAAGEGVDGLAEFEVAEADFFEELKALDGAGGRTGIGEGGKESNGFFDGGVEEVGDGEGGVMRDA